MPVLRQLLQDAEETVRLQARRELALMRDQAAIDSILSDLRPNAQFSTDRLCTALDDVAAAHLIDGTTAVRQIFQKTDTIAGFDAIKLKMRAGWTAFSLGDVKSVPTMIEMLPLVPERTRGLGGPTPLETLRTYTGEDFGLNQIAWTKWWSATEDGFHLFTGHLEPKERDLIMQTVICWCRTKESGPLADAPIVYVEKAEHDSSLRSDAVRMYTAVELRLLKKPWISIRGLQSNGKRAFASVVALNDMTEGLSWCIELRRQPHEEWTVVAASRQ